MTHHNDEGYHEHEHEHGHHEERRGGGGFVSGFLFGGLLGAALGVVFAPRAGEETRRLIRDRGMELRSQVTDGIDDARTTATEALDDVVTRVDTLQQRGREFVAENRDRIEKTASAVKETAKETWTEGGQRQTTNS